MIVDDGSKASRFRENADEIRARAETINDAKTIEITLRLAAGYERLATDYDALARLTDYKQNSAQARHHLHRTVGTVE